MKSVRLHEFHKPPVVDEVPEPTIGGPLDVIVKIGGAGVCRTDLHIMEGQWDAAMHTPLPYILGHENAGWVHEIGSAVTNVAVGDTVILHPTPTCGLCRACRAGDDMHCINSPGNSLLTQCMSSPARQAWHSPQVGVGCRITVSPTATLVTAEPVSCTQPAFSWPRM